MTIIAVDPSVSGSGVCVLKDGKVVDLAMMKTWELYEFLENAHYDIYDSNIVLVRKKLESRPIILVENSNLISSMWHGATGRANVGKNQAISQEIVDFAKAKKMNVVELKPDGYSKTYPNEAYFKADTKWKGKSNKDTRAAAAMCIRYWKSEYYRNETRQKEDI